MAKELYERIGGEATMKAAVDLLYRKIVADELLAPFFLGLDMMGLAVKQTAFLSSVFGGPREYRGRPLRQAHAKLVAESGLGDAHFDRMMELLQTTLTELSISEPLISEIMARVSNTRDEVLGR